MSFSILHLGPAMQRFLTRYPGVTLELNLDDRQVDLVEEGFDVAIRIGRLQDSNLIARKIAPCRQVMCASPAYLAQARRRRSGPRICSSTTASCIRC